jgi:secondary thiamine-phosphate synthase enzyme
MTVVTREIRIETKADGGMVDLTDKICECIKSSNLRDGVVCVFCPGSTGAISTVEYEPGLTKDIPDALERIAPKKLDYAHHQTWHDDNGSGHVKATLLGPSITVPFTESKPMLGTWQQIVFIECDTRNRNRKIIAQIMGE